MKQKEVFKFPLMRIGAYLQKYGNALIEDKSSYKKQAEKAHLVRNAMNRGKIDFVVIGRERFVVLTDRTKRLKKLEWKAFEQAAQPLPTSYVCILEVMQIGDFISSLSRSVVQNSVRYAMTKNNIDFIAVDRQNLVVITEKTTAHQFRERN